MESALIPYSPILHRPPLRWPNGARVALWIVPNIEHYEYLPKFVRTRDPWPRSPHPDVLGYAARDYGNNFAGGREAAVLCNLADARYRGRCYEGVGTILGALHTYEAGRRAACAAVTPPKYRRNCLRGAAVI